MGKLQGAFWVFGKYNQKLFIWLLQSKQDTTCINVFIDDFMHVIVFKNKEAESLKQLERKKPTEV